MNKRARRMALRVLTVLYILLVPVVCMLSALGAELHGSLAIYQTAVWVWLFVVLYIVTKEWFI